MVIFGKLRWALLPALVLLGLSGPAKAQQLSEGSREVVGYVGGIERDGGAFTLGGGYGYALRSRWLLIGEIGLLHKDDSTGVEVGANAHYLFPLSDYPKVTPYGLVGLGLAHLGGTTAGGINFGGGARWQTGRDWGIRPEIKFLAGNHFYTRFSVGVYYQFGK